LLTTIITLITAVTICTVPQFTKFNHELWYNHLDGFEFRDTVCDGIKNGFNTYISNEFISNVKNTIKNPIEHLLPITKWLVKGVTKCYMLGPFTKENNPFPNLHISPLFAVPKRGKDGWRPVHHLSYPHWGRSINELIPEKYKKVQYVKFKDIVKMVYERGQGAYMWTIDAQDAYLRVPVQRNQWKFLGIEWFGYIFIMTCLPFGLASSCAIYTVFADAVEYIVRNAHPYVFYVKTKNTINKLICHYLDDFIGVHSRLEYAIKQYDYLIAWFNKLGIPTQPDKCSPPSQIQILLGWLYNTIKQKVFIPPEKVKKIVKLLIEILIAPYVTRKQLEIVDGNLQWASLAIFPGKAFVRRLELFIHKHTYTEHIILDDRCKEDINWWIHAIQSAQNGFPMEWIIKNPKQFELQIYTDASTSIGCGGFSSDGLAYQCRWTDTIFATVAKKRYTDITLLELLGVVVTAVMWAPRWSGKCVHFLCDNPGATAAIAKKAAKFHRPDCDELVRLLARLAVDYHFYFWADHIKGCNNVQADALSRFKSGGDNNVHIMDSVKDVNYCLEIVQNARPMTKRIYGEGRKRLNGKRRRAKRKRQMKYNK
jgi:hypothetical protein